MLIVCPTCARRYSIDEDHIGPAGRAVRCASCREAFFVAPPDAEATEGALDPAAPAPIPASEPYMPPARALEVAQAPSEPTPIEAFAEIPEPVAPPPRRASRPAPLRPRRGLPRRALAAGAVLLLLGGAVFGRDTVVRQVPRLNSLYALAHIPVNLRGLEFRGITSEVVQDPGGPLLVVAGEIANIRSRDLDVPKIALSVQGPNGATIYDWQVEPAKPTLAPGETMAFRARLASPPADGQNVLVRFVKEDGPAALAAKGQGS